jgi:hypothetical protein
MTRLIRFISLVITATLILSASTTISRSTANSYDIAGVYEKQELKSGSKVIDSYNDVEDAKYVLIPTKIDTGKYNVELTRIDTNFYQICGTSLVIETKYCHEYANREDVILNITSNYGYTRGEVIFL